MVDASTVDARTVDASTQTEETKNIQLSRKALSVPRLENENGNDMQHMLDFYDRIESLTNSGEYVTQSPRHTHLLTRLNSKSQESKRSIDSKKSHEFSSL